MNHHGFVRVTVCSPEVTIGDPAANVTAIRSQLDLCKDSDVVVFPELCITGYTCADLFRQQTLLEASGLAVLDLARSLAKDRRLVFVGAPFAIDCQLFNCAFAINCGRIVGVVPKQHIPNYSEFYEKRWFTPATAEHQDMQVQCKFDINDIPFGIDLLFGSEDNLELRVFAELCEDLFMPIPPSSIACMSGATLIVNLSASPETVAKSDYRRELVKNQSGRCIAGYAYASAGPSESTTDLVFSGHCIIAENDNVLVETTHVGDGTLSFGARMVTADIDVEKCDLSRQSQDTFGDCRRYIQRDYRNIGYVSTPAILSEKLLRHVDATPFVPSKASDLKDRCAAIFDLQVGGLYRRWKHLNFPVLNLGVSGGLDSTHALLVLHKMVTNAGFSPEDRIHCKTMPGFGTTKATKGIALDLMRELKVHSEEINIRPLCMQMFRDLGHKPFGLDIQPGDNLMFSELTPEQLAKGDLVFENVQARARTFMLMSSGFTVGTGDMSELALGFCTFNGDHASMYNPNVGVPKTLIKFMVNYVADNHYPAGRIRDLLHLCANLTISPQLLPTDADGNDQSSESIVGPYELNDFYLFNMVRNGFSPEKILYLAEHGDLSYRHSPTVRLATMRSFLTRFFSQQYKRSFLPDGPKVGTVSLSPRGDWRMASDASARVWLASCEGT